MVEAELAQAEADALIAMEKHRSNDEDSRFPGRGQSLSLPLESADGRERFLLDLSRGRIDLRKVKMQNRARRVVVLVRLDVGGPPHRNPDDVEIGTPHIHLYRAGHGDKWAYPVPRKKFRDLTDEGKTLQDFLDFCNVTEPPRINMGLVP